MGLEHRIEDFIIRMRNSDDSWQISGTYYSIKATLNDYKKHGQSYNKQKVDQILPKMEITYREWQNKMEKIKQNSEIKKRKYSPQMVIIKSLKNQKKE